MRQRPHLYVTRWTTCFQVWIRRLQGSPPAAVLHSGAACTARACLIGWHIDDLANKQALQEPSDLICTLQPPAANAQQAG